MSLKGATVVEIVVQRDDVQIVRLCIDTDESTETVPAYNYRALGPEVAVGERVLANTAGLDLSLGTGGVAFIVPGEPSAKDALATQDTQYGHIVKLRYTPLQRAVDSVEEQASPYHELLKDAQSIEGMPVVCCELHSQLPLVAAAIRHEVPEANITYIMQDVAALPLAFSRVVQQLLEAHLLNHTITCGQAFGGEYEAVTVHSALLAARYVCRADVALVAPGPGVVGTATAFGHSGVAQGEALNAVALLKGKPLAPLRLSFKDTRERHKGLSHHSETALGKVCTAKAHIAVPGNLEEDHRLVLEKQLQTSGIQKKHCLMPLSYDFDSIDTKGIEVTTMGRTRDEDPAFFSAAFAAGILAALSVKVSQYSAE